VRWREGCNLSCEFTRYALAESYSTLDFIAAVLGREHAALKGIAFEIGGKSVVILSKTVQSIAEQTAQGARCKGAICGL